jgi:ATP-dependent 26S proteasome regulatory subunit
MAPTLAQALAAEPIGTALPSELLLALARLDQLLIRALEHAPPGEWQGDPFRGLLIDAEEAGQLLAHPPGTPLLYTGASDSAPDGRLTWLADAFGLGFFECDVVLLALAPELDLRYERLFAHLQSQVGRRRPTVDLALHLLCADAGERLARRASFAPRAPLLRHGLLRLIAERSPASLLDHSLALDGQVVHLLLGESGPDSRLAPFCELLVPGPTLAPAGNLCSLHHIVDATRRERQPLRLAFSGPDAGAKRRAVAALASAASIPLLTADLTVAHDLPWAGVFRLLFREAWFADALLFLEGVDDLRERDEAAFRQLVSALAADCGVTVLAVKRPWQPTGEAPLGVLDLAFDLPDAAARQALWASALVGTPVTDLAALAERFQLGATQIADAALNATMTAAYRAGGSHSAVAPQRAELFAAARSQTGHQLAAMARKIEPARTWEALVLPDDALAQLRELCRRCTLGSRVLDEWGFGPKLAATGGVTALFSGPPGTGKTMAAEVVAGELGLDLYAINLAAVVSKYIGETEKNLERVFATAEGSNAILFFDEADALFGKRSEVKDAHDRYSNIEVAYLLQKMERYSGVAILASNQSGDMDEAFRRRLDFSVYFPFPGSAERRRIWHALWPPGAPKGDDVDFATLAERVALSGGHLRNIALAAAFLAAGEDGPVTTAHLSHAVRREYQKLGVEVEAAGVELL